MVSRWLHAGLFKDPDGTTRNIWYAFQEYTRKIDGSTAEKIVYAGNNKGAWLGNLDIGQIKRNLITFDEHHRGNWAHLLTDRGQWRYRQVHRGRRLQLQSLKDTFHNPGFRDLYSEGRIGAIGPSFNAIHEAGARG